MKRSKMISIIEEVLGGDCPYLADDVLIAIQEAGMLPPEITIEHNDIHVIGFDGIETTEVEDQIVNEWEPETSQESVND